MDDSFHRVIYQVRQIGCVLTCGSSSFPCRSRLAAVRSGGKPQSATHALPPKELSQVLLPHGGGTL